MNSMLKPKIKLNINHQSVPQIQTVTSYSCSYDLINDIEPYRKKVVEKLKITEIKSEYIEKLEEILHQKSIMEAEKLRCMRNSDLYKNLYLAICRHLIVNLVSGNSINNTHFIDQINQGLISLEEAVEMTPQEMYKDRWKVLIDKKLLDIDKSTKDPEATTDMFSCGKCHRNKCKYFERQDRSADEPMTIHITCCHCGRKWKQ